MKIYIRNYKSSHIFGSELANSTYHEDNIQDCCRVYECGENTLSMLTVKDKVQCYKLNNVNDKGELIDRLEMLKTYHLNEKPYNFLLDVSLEVEKAMSSYFKKFKSVKSKKDNESIYNTDIYVNVNFNNYKFDYINRNGGVSTKQINGELIRDYLYKSGFTLNGKRYIKYKRTSSKSRQGSCLFIQEKYYEDMMKWSHLGKKIPTDCVVPLDKIESYQALVLSGIKSTINIKPSQILMLNDVIVSDRHKVAVIGENLDIEIKQKLIENNLFDGQSLIDSEYVKKGKSTALLRNHFFKSNGISTNLKEFFEAENITKVQDDFTGEWKDVDDIKLVITPSSLKWLSMTDILFNGDKVESYRWWLKSIENQPFGIVKNELWKREYNPLNYQIMSSLNLSNSDIESLLKHDIDVVDKLNNDLNEFLKYISLDDSSLTRQMITKFTKAIPEFEYSDMFRNFRKETVRQYKNNLYGGNISCKSQWQVICGNPDIMLELLKLSIEDREKYIVHLDGEGYKTLADDECYSPLYENGEKIAVFRSPHVCSSNILQLTNKRFDKDSNPFKHFNFNDSCLVLNTFKSLSAEILANCDFDHDTVLSTTELVPYIQPFMDKDKYPCPIVDIQGRKMDYNYDPLDMSKLDNNIAKNLIGQIINTSCHLQSIYFHEMNNGKDEEFLSTLFKDILLLSGLSMVEIDKCKKQVPFDMSKKLKTIKDKYADYNNLPLFMEDIKKNTGGKSFEKYDCTLDRLINLLSDNQSISSEDDINKKLFPSKERTSQSFDMAKLVESIPNDGKVNYKKIDDILVFSLEVYRLKQRINIEKDDDKKEQLKRKLEFKMRELKNVPKDFTFQDLVVIFKKTFTEETKSNKKERERLEKELKEIDYDKAKEKEVSEKIRSLKKDLAKVSINKIGMTLLGIVYNNYKDNFTVLIDVLSKSYKENEKKCGKKL